MARPAGGARRPAQPHAHWLLLRETLVLGEVVPDNLYCGGPGPRPPETLHPRRGSSYCLANRPWRVAKNERLDLPTMRNRPWRSLLNHRPNEKHHAPTLLI